MLKRLVCLFLAAALGFSFVIAEDTAAPFIMAGFDDTMYRNWTENSFFLRMEEKTGVDFDYLQFTTQEEWENYKKSLKKDGEMPDVLFKANLSSAECMEMVNSGVLIDLMPYLPECCPNLWALMQEDESILSAVTMPDGTVPALPYITKIPTQNYLWINQKFLDALKLSAPATAEELKNVLIAFRDQDPNRNGKADEIPLGFLGPFDLKFMAHAFGLICNDYNLFEKDGKACFMPLEAEFPAFISWCRDLYAQKLMDQKGFATTSKLREVTDSKAAETYGMVIAPAAADVFRTDWASDYVLMEPLFYNGVQIYRDFAGGVLLGAFAVTAHCTDVQKMLRWVDTLYTEEGTVLATIGKENVDYMVDGDGTWRFTESAQDDPYFTVNHLIDGGGITPGILVESFQRRFSGNAKLQKILDDQIRFNQKTRLPFPILHLTQQQLSVIVPLQQTIGAYVDTQIARWVLGEEEFSTEAYEQFKISLDEMGLPAFMAFWQDLMDHR